jgi:uncharacterized membrane protein YhaH (DUF805 family)
MDFFEAISSGFNNYVNFRTRAIRSEYWFWVLFVLLLGIVAQVIDAVVFGMLQGGPAGIIVFLATFLPGLAVSIRRLHDRDKSGWWILLLAIPLVGAIILLVWFCTRGTVGPNRFGPDPLEGRL